MTGPIQLHPRIREKKVARISASSLALYILATPDRQDELLHDQRFQSGYVVPKHQQALSVIRAFCTDLSRDWSRYERARAALLEKSRSGELKPSQREEAARCVESIDLFRDHAGNTFGALKTPFFEAPSFNKLSIKGLLVSVVPDLVVSSPIPVEAGRKVGLVFIRAQKRPDPNGCKTDQKKAERRAIRREILAYTLVLGDMMLRGNGVSDLQIDRKRFRGWDLRLGEEVEFPSDRVTRERRIKSACGQIARLWETIEPKPSDLV